MIRGFYTAGSGLSCQQSALDNTANNIANVSTTAFKKQSVRFGELLYSTIGARDGDDPRVGNGARMSGLLTDQSRGGLVYTGNGLDFALRSEGYFAVMTAEGVRYTRDGSFAVSHEPTGDYLVTASGAYVMGKDGGRIALDGGDIQGRIAVFDFANPSGLRKIGGNIFEATAESGEAFAVDGDVCAGFLELSNVDLVTEMADLIAIQKAYQFNAKMLQTADEIESTVNNLR